MTIAISGGAGVFTIQGETITQATSGATATYLYDDGTFIYANYLAGTWTTPGPLTVTGGTSGATRTGAAVVTGLTAATSDYSLRNAIIAGFKYAEFMWINGQKVTGAEYGWSHYPFDYPDATSAGDPLNISPLTQVQAEAAFVAAGYPASAYNNAVKAGIDTANIKGSLYGISMYMGPTPGNIATDTATLDTYSELIRHLSSDVSFDTQSVGSHTNTAPPSILASVDVWCEANRRAYSTAGSGSPAITNGAKVDHWTSMVGSKVWTQTTDANRPTIKTNAINGYSSLLFNGTSARMILSSAFTPGAAYTAGFVIKPTAVDAILFSKSGGGDNEQVRLNEGLAGTISLFSIGTLSTLVTAAAQFTAGTWCIVRLRYDGTNLRVYVNGTQVSSYTVGPAFGASLSLDVMGCFRDGGSNFFNGEVASMFFAPSTATDNQIELIEAYWATKYALTIAGSPVLPHIAFIDRLNTTYSKKAYRENFNYRSIANLSDWDTNGGGIVGVYSELANALTNAATYYTRASIGTGQRARILVTNIGSPTPAARIAEMVAATLLGYDVSMDIGGFTTAQMQSAVSQHSVAADLFSAASVGVGTQAQARAQQRRRHPPIFIRK